MAIPERGLIPLLAYRDLQAIHDFLVEAFQLRPGGVEIVDGEAVHAEVYTDNGSTIWLHRHAPQHGLASPDGGDAVTAGIVLIVGDVDAHHQHAAAHGVKIDYAPMNQDYGVREYGARDPEGGRWYIATPT